MGFLAFMGAFLLGVVAIVTLEIVGLGVAIDSLGMSISQLFQVG